MADRIRLHRREISVHCVWSLMWRRHNRAFSVFHFVLEWSISGIVCQMQWGGGGWYC